MPPLDVPGLGVEDVAFVGVCPARGAGDIGCQQFFVFFLEFFEVGNGNNGAGLTGLRVNGYDQRCRAGDVLRRLVKGRSLLYGLAYRCFVGGGNICLDGHFHEYHHADTPDGTAVDKLQNSLQVLNSE